jgi:gamma-glutamylcyclotransferase (GGCT)/AIG2-like uncharacterized protein YtfP
VALVFIYGSLMRGQSNHAVLLRLGASLVSLARTKEHHVLVDLGPYPALLRNRDGADTAVTGELWQVDVAGLAELDAFEGSPDLYVRDALTVLTEDGAEHVAEAYVFARRLPRGARRIRNGSYAAASLALDNPPATEDRASPPPTPR